MERVERYNKRKNKLNQSENLILSSKIKGGKVVDYNLLDNTLKKLEETYNTDFNISSTEVKQFLKKFQKDFHEERFNKLVVDCKNEVIQSIVTPFGLGKIVAAYDKAGGNVTTLHNFEKGKDFIATDEDKAKYDEWQNSVNSNVDRKVHDIKKDEWKKQEYKNMKDGDIVIDGYTGKELGIKENNRINKNNSIHGEHITSVSEIEKDSKNHLYAKGDNQAQRLEDRAKISGDKENLTLIDGGMNSSKSDNDLMDWANSPISKEHAKETGNPNMTNAEYYELNPELLKKKYDKSKSFIKNEQRKKQFKKQSKEATITSVKEGFKMGTQQALGLIISEFFTALFDEIIDIYKKGFSNDFEDKQFFIILRERLARIGKRVQAKWKDAAIVFKDGFISGFISNLVTLMINMFVTTGKRVVRIIREGIFSLFRAVKMLMFPPENMTYEEAMHESSKLLAGGIIISLGVLLEEYVDKLIKTTPILEPYTDTITTIFIGTLTGLTVTMTAYYLDKKRDDKQLFKNLLEATNEDIKQINSSLQACKLVVL
ncbi:lactate permease [Malaciobacter canalis]|uniref:Lactate permease n=1 Tax=Malaciobacter canalis TaxID=1912871 RepID=A0ABX4LNW6_9BACT|nr:lactate permease [Malaciobacter canalis]PHO09601.1 lactate permease [Malaciobacter canalis]QEE31668.1 hypothetical protein ACAN_0132 [Malaciobacter canalis]